MWNARRRDRTGLLRPPASTTSLSTCDPVRTAAPRGAVPGGQRLRLVRSARVTRSGHRARARRRGCAAARADRQRQDRGRRPAAVVPDGSAALARTLGPLRLSAQGSAQQPRAPVVPNGRLARPAGGGVARRRLAVAEALHRGGTARPPADYAGVPGRHADCLLYTSPSPRDGLLSR